MGRQQGGWQDQFPISKWNVKIVHVINLNTKQVVAALKQSEQQLLDVEEVAGTNQQKGVTGDNDDEDENDDVSFRILSLWEYA